MNNRWGRPVDPKGSLRGSGQNNINININFNAMKDKPVAFAGKKIDNFIQISNQPKQAPRPNISIETLKQKKKSNPNKQQVAVEGEMHRKKSKTRIINQVCTPQKNYKGRDFLNSKSVGKVSTKKRSAKSYQNLKKYFGHHSPKDLSKEQSPEQTPEYSNSRSKSKSRSKQKSTKNLLKNSSKTKIGLSSINSRAKNNSHNSKKQQQKKTANKTKKSSSNKTQKTISKPQQSAKPSTAPTVTRKKSFQKIPRKKSSQEQSKKTIKPKSKNKQQQDGLKRLPLHDEEDNDQPFDEQRSYQKHQNQVLKLLHGEQAQKIFSHKREKKNRNQSSSKKKQTFAELYTRDNYTPEQWQQLEEAVTIIQKNWRGCRARAQFISELSQQELKIQNTKKKIANIDPKFWDDAQSNSILHAPDSETPLSSLGRSLQNDQLNQKTEEEDIQIRVSMCESKQEKQENTHNEQEEMRRRISMLEEFLKAEREKAQKLEQENKGLKVQLQKNTNSAVQSLQSSIQSSKQAADKNSESMGEPEKKYYMNDPFLEQQMTGHNKAEEEEQFQLRLPKKITKSDKKNEAQPHQQEQKKQPSISESRNKRLVNAVYQCVSPKQSNLHHISINKSILNKLAEKQDKVKQQFRNKIGRFDQLLNDRIISPRTYENKRKQFHQVFAKEREKIRGKIQIVSEAVGVIEQIVQEIKPALYAPKQEPKTQYSIIREQNHIIQDFGNVNLDSYRAGNSEEGEAMESSLQSSHEFNKRIAEAQSDRLSRQIENSNDQIIKISKQVVEYHEDQQSQIKRHQNTQQYQSLTSQVEAPPPKAPQGFESTLLFIREYCMELIEFIRNNQPHRTVFVGNVCTPIKCNQLALLESYRRDVNNKPCQGKYSGTEQHLYPYYKFLNPSTPVISVEAFMDFNRSYQRLKPLEKYEAERQFFLSSILDGFNEALDYKRPCGANREPPVWHNYSQGLKNYYLISQAGEDKQDFIRSEKFDQICGLAIGKVIEWSTSLCGFIPESPEMENVEIPQAQIAQIRQSRLALVLEKDLLQNQDQILRYQMEETEVKLFYSLEIFDHLLEQFVQEFIRREPNQQFLIFLK